MSCVLRTIKCHASPIDRPIRDPARAHVVISLSLSFPFYLFTPYSYYTSSYFTKRPDYISIAFTCYRIARAHTYAGVLAHTRTRTHTHPRNIISARNDPTFLRLHVGLRMPSVRNTSVQCHVINRANRCRPDARTCSRPLVVRFVYNFWHNILPFYCLFSKAW